MKRSGDEQLATLQDALHELQVNVLKALAKLTGASDLPTRKDDLTNVIVRYLNDDQRLRDVFELLDDTQQLAVAEAVHGSNTLSTSRFYAKYRKRPYFGGDNDWRPAPSPLMLFFPSRLQLPLDLKARLKAYVPEPPADQVKSLAALPAHFEFQSAGRQGEGELLPMTVREAERGAQQELISVLRLIDTGKLAASEATGRPTGASMAAITAVLEGGDYYAAPEPGKKKPDEPRNPGPIRAFAWPLLLQAGGLAQMAGTKLQLTARGRRALSEPTAATLKLLWEKWLTTTLLDELARIECVKGQSGKAKHSLTAASGRRTVIADGLAACPQNEWVAPQELQRFIDAAGGFSLSRNPWHLYICEPRYGALGYEDWIETIEDRYFFAFLMEYAGTLGMIDVAFVHPDGARPDYGGIWGTDDLAFLSRYDGLAYVRLTALGAYCLGVALEYELPALKRKPVLRLLPNLEIAATGRQLDSSDCMALDAYAVRVSDRLWRLERATLLSAVEAGRSIQEIREFLSARCAGSMPDTVSGLLDDTAERCMRVWEGGQARLYECRDEVLAALIANDSRTRKHCLRAGDTHLAVPASADAAFRKGLRALGYLVAAAAPAARRKPHTEPGEPAIVAAAEEAPVET